MHLGPHPEYLRGVTCGVDAVGEQYDNQFLFRIAHNGGSGKPGVEKRQW